MLINFDFVQISQRTFPMITAYCLNLVNPETLTLCTSARGFSRILQDDPVYIIPAGEDNIVLISCKEVLRYS